MKFLFKNKKGFTIIEIIIACAIISISTFAFMSSAAKGTQLSNQVLRQTQASLLLEEGAEAVKSIREINIIVGNTTTRGWTTFSNFSLNTDYYLVFNTSTNKWDLDTNPAIIDSIFTRKVVISAVYRDANDDIASSGTLDTGTKKVTVNVSWKRSDGITVSKDLIFYMSDIFN